MERSVNGDDLRDAREKLGRMWGKDRPLALSEMARALRLKGRDPGGTVLLWEKGDGPTGPASVAIEMMLDGALPPDPLDDIFTTRPREVK